MEREEVPPTSYKLVGTTPSGRLFGSPVNTQILDTQTHWAQFDKGKGNDSKLGQIVSPSETIAWDWNKVLSPTCRLGQHHPQGETLLIYPPEPGASTQLKMLLQRGQLATPNLKLWHVPPGGD